MDVREALRRSRQVMAVVMNPAMRAALLQRGPADGTERAPARFDWLPDGAVDALLLRRTVDVVESLLADDAILRFERIGEMPADERRRRALSVEVVRVVFERLAPRGGLTEERLNAALAVLVEDVALVRRDAVDAGFLDRTPDGPTYTLRPAPFGAEGVRPCGARQRPGSRTGPRA